MPPEKERWLAHWAHLFDEVVTSGLCTGCAGCVIACPHDVLGYDDSNGVYKPFHLEEEGGPGGCGHGDRGCTSCTRACPRFRAWEPEIDEFMFGRAREAQEVSGLYKDIVLARAADPILHEVGQDGGLVSAILVYALEHDVIDAALVSFLEGDGSTWKAIPGVARNRDDVIASAGSRYTYSANTLAYSDAIESGAERIAPRIVPAIPGDVAVVSPVTQRFVACQAMPHIDHARIGACGQHIWTDAPIAGLGSCHRNADLNMHDAFHFDDVIAQEGRASRF